MKLDCSNIQRYIDNGQSDGNWYNDVNKLLRDNFPDFDIDLVIDVFCATSMNTSLEGNVTLAVKALYQIKHGLPLKGYMPNILLYLGYAINKERFVGRKIRNFSEAMKGNSDAIVVDIWITRAFNLERKKLRRKTGRTHTLAPRTSEYDAIEKYFREEAEKMGLEPRHLCAMVWGGIRKEWTGRENTTYDRVLAMKLKTHSLFPIFP